MELTNSTFWFRITKTGGTSLEVALSNMPNLVTITVNPFNCNKYIYDSLLFKNAFKFTVVRNPYEKIISSWKWLTVGNGNKRFNRFKTMFNNNTSFEEFLINIEKLRFSYEQYKHKIMPSGTIIPNVKLIKHSVEYEYFWAIQHVESCFNTINTFINPMNIDLVIKLEELNNNKNILEQKLDYAFQLKHFNRTRINRDYSQYYINLEIKDKIQNMYKKDFEFFNYKE